MKESIEVHQIREGDLIRFEPEAAPYSAFEWRASHAADTSYRAVDGQHFLIGHGLPQQVVLPSKPTLGWLTTPNRGTRLRVWRREGSTNFVSAERDNALRQDVTAFIPAVAVPATALEFLEANVDCSGPLSCLREHVEAFLVSVREVNQ